MESLAGPIREGVPGGREPREYPVEYPNLVAAHCIYMHKLLEH